MYQQDSAKGATGTVRMVIPRRRKQVRINNPLKTQTTKNQQHANNDVHQELQHSTHQQIQNYSGSTVGNGIHMQSFLVHDLLPFDQCRAELTKSSSHKGQTTKEPQHTHSDMKRGLQHST
jgi:hypothetical protein